MTDNDDFASATDNEALRATYRSGPQEQVPPHLDEAVMRNARTEAQKDFALRWFIPWRRPVAFAVMASLSLAIVIEMSELAVFEQSPLPASATQQEFAREAVASSARMRRIGETATHLSLGETSDVSQADIAAKGGTLCSDDQIESPESWLECVVMLRANGFLPEAHAEMDRLLLAYPDFTPLYK